MIDWQDIHYFSVLAQAGSLSAAVLPRFLGDADPALVRMPTASPPPTRAVWLATYPDLRRSPAIRAVLAFLAQAVARGCPQAGPEP